MGVYFSMPQRSLDLEFLLDTNRINAKGGQPYMNVLERWHTDEVIKLHIAEEVLDEASHGSQQRAMKAAEYICWLVRPGTSEEFVVLGQIEKILFGEERTKSLSQKRDAGIVLTAWKYRLPLITNDGGSRKQPRGILGSKSELERLGIRVMRDSEAVQMIQEQIATRDKLARKLAEPQGVKLPEWVGRD